jgi:hypothetical protein
MTVSTRRRRLAVAAGVAIAILVPAVQQGGGFGMSQSAFAAQGDATLRAPGFAFTIWTLIYLGMGAYAIYQSRARDSRALRALAWPAATSTAACGAWIVAAAMNQMWATVAIILVAAGSAVAGLWRAAQEAAGRDRLLAILPVALLGGWLALAAPLNLLTVMTAKGLIAPDAAAAWAIGAVTLVVAIGAMVALRTGAWAFPLPIAWGLAAIYVAERAQKPGVALLAAVAAGAMLAVAAVAGFRRRRG